MKKMIKNILNSLGYEIKRKTPASDDPFSAQKVLLNRPDPVIFDVGAYKGTVTRHYRELFPMASIFSFEPHPELFGILKENISGNIGISCHKMAISDSDGHVTLNINRFAAASSVLPVDPDGSAYWGDDIYGAAGNVKVTSVTIDSFCRDNSIPEVDILKLDIQGYELEALRGAAKMMKRGAIPLVYLEIITAPTYRGQHGLHEYLDLFDSFGYEIYNIYDPVKRGSRLLQFDAIFARKGLDRKGHDREHSLPDRL